ncbi:TSUP family transporter [Halorubellus litoreus]|uniref:Probable membrane transporter protein n=1 Tax=Halorubellus litoreus TaxID=755308 RepID=A0ABD5V6Q1_9EURY
MSLSTSTVLLVLVVVGLGGVVKGLVGFGYAIAGTAVLASLLSPTTAVALMIVPMLAANLRLLGELTGSGLRSCVGRFWPFVAAAVVGTVGGMAVLSVVPGRVVATGLGAFTLAYVVLQQDRVRVPGVAAFERTCFVETTTMKALLGFASGVVFGVSNAAVQVVAYLDSLDLDRETFAGVLAMILVGVSTVRLGVAWQFGLFEAGSTLWVSAAAAVPGVAGVALGERFRDRVDDAVLARVALALFAVIAVRLLSKGVLGV